VLGVDLRPLDPRESAALGLGSGEGLAVTAVDPRGPASGVLEEGDILLALDNRGITLARLKAVVARLQRGAHATLVIQRGPDRFALRL
jgi:S1-C subfamily serine protease